MSHPLPREVKRGAAGGLGRLAGRLSRLLGRADPAQGAASRALYGHAVAQARLPAFYAELEVPDTLDGRFDCLILHVALLVRRLARGGPDGAALAQDLFDETFADMDRSLREMGVGDLGVGRRVKAMAKAFYGRADAYGRALDAGDEAALAAALARNLHARDEASPVAHRLAAYAFAADRMLAAQDDAGLAAGEAHFPSPPAAP